MRFSFLVLGQYACTAAHMVHRAGDYRVVSSPGEQIPYMLVGADGTPVEAVRDYLLELLASDCSPLTVKSYAFDLLAFCRRYGIVPVRVTAEPAGPADIGWIDTRLAPGEATGLHALVDDPSLTVLVRPDRVIAAVASRSELPRLPWTTT